MCKGVGGVINIFNMLILLTVCTVSDIRLKKLPLWIIGMSGAAGIICNILSDGASFMSMAVGIMVGIFIVVTSIVTKGQIGMGDGCLFISIGAVIGSSTVSLFVGALILCFAVSGVLFVAGKVKKRDRIPFVPFVFLSYICMLIINGVEV